MTQPDARVVIPAGRFRAPMGWKHLVPIARFLIEERGHLPLYEPERWGFTGTGLFQFSRRITDEDWEAINQRFVIPPNVWFHNGLIRDQENGVDFLGVEELMGLNGVEPVELWEAEEWALDRTYGPPDLGEGKAGPIPAE
jgi:hypothetical protein